MRVSLSSHVDVLHAFLSPRNLRGAANRGKSAYGPVQLRVAQAKDQCAVPAHRVPRDGRLAACLTPHQKGRHAKRCADVQVHNAHLVNI